MKEYGTLLIGDENLYDGPDTGSIGQRVTTWTVRQGRSR